jgi:hypothetical protein
MKRKLRLDELKVDTFATAAGGTQRGTVRGHGDNGTDFMVCTGECTEAGWHTCDFDCGMSHREQRACVGTDTCP